MNKNRFLEGARRLVLVVEDNDLNREMLVSMLEPHCHVITAANGRDGLELLHEYREKVSLVLLDLVMPVMDGYQVMAAMQKDHSLKSIPVIVTTASSSYNEQIKALENGASDFVVKPYQQTIRINRVNALVRLRESIEILQTAETDQLTGAYTSSFFMHYAEDMLEEHPDAQFDLISSNVESFRMIQDRQGRKAAEGLIRYISSVLKRELKEDELLGRMSENRFSMFVYHRPEESYKETENRVRQALEHAPVYPVMQKFGVYPSVDHSESLPVMLDKASYALETTMHRYGVNLAMYDDKVRQAKEKEQDIVEHMERALENREFLVVFQPKHEVSSDSTGGAEALVRWKRPGIGMVSPGEFIPVFEQNGFISQLDFYVWEETCRILREMIMKGGKVVPVSINISRSDFDTQDLDSVIADLADKYGIPHSFLHLEVTESAYHDNPYQVRRVIENLHNDGFKIELDDFGVGYSTLSMLFRVPLDVIKLDMSIVQGLKNKENRTVLSSIIEMSARLGLETVAEGAETMEQAQELKKLGCTFIQGYFYSKPMLPEKFEEYLREN